MKFDQQITNEIREKEERLCLWFLRHHITARNPFQDFGSLSTTHPIKKKPLLDDANDPL